MDMKVSVQATEAVFPGDSEKIEAEIKYRAFPEWTRRVRQVGKSFNKGLKSGKVKARDCLQVDMVGMDRR